MSTGKVDGRRLPYNEYLGGEQVPELLHIGIYLKISHEKLCFMAQMHPALHSIFIKSTLLQFFTQKKWFYQKNLLRVHILESF